MKQVFIAADGEIFDTQAECEAHERVLESKTKIEEWAAKKYDRAASATRAINTVVSWESDRTDALA